MADPTPTAAHQQRLARLNALWHVAGQPPASGSARHRLLFKTRQFLASLLRPQETFNAAVVDYINHSTTLVEQSLQTLDDSIRHREALLARERRMEAAMAAMRATHDELRQSVGVLQNAVQLLRQEVSGLRSPVPGPETVHDRRPETVDRGPRSDSLGHKYVGFEDQFRGSREAIRERLADYAPLFAGASDVLDIGCGRGEFLALLREQGVSARGIDTNATMVEVCREKGLQAGVADAVGFLQAQPPASLGGVFAAQVVEHLEPAYLAALLDAAFAALRPGAPIVLETINPACWFAFFESYIRDITHVRPLHPDTLKYLLLATGFQRLDVRYRVPYPEHEKLQPLPAGSPLGEAVETLNGNVEKLNRLLFTYLDYAAIGYRP